MLFPNFPFPRGKGPLVSVLMPSRGRPNSLIRAIESLYNLAYNKPLIEFCVKIDDDDTATIEALHKLAEEYRPNLHVKRTISPRGNGYADIHKYFNTLAATAMGDWLFIFEDGARILTYAWDQILLDPNVDGVSMGCADGIYALLPRVISRPGSHEMVIVRREVYKILGHLSRSPHIDTYLSSLMIFLNRTSECYIDIRHENPADPTTDDREKIIRRTIVELCLPPMLRHKLEDAEKLLAQITNWHNNNIIRFQETPEKHSTVISGLLVSEQTRL